MQFLTQKFISNESKTLFSLQLLRALAAILVVIHHSSHLNPEFKILDFGTFGIVGVDIFFVLSGFIMIYISPDNACYKQFIKSRVARIVPLYFIFTSLLILLVSIKPDLFRTVVYSFPHYVSSILFLPFEAPDGRVRPLLSIGWTLNFEFYFYLLFALFCTFKPKLRILFISLSMVLVSCLSLFIFTENTLLEFYANSIFVEFIFGMILAVIFKSGYYFNKQSSFVLFVFSFVLFFVLQNTNLHQYRVLVYGLPAFLLVVSSIGLEINSAKIWQNKIMAGVFLKVGDASYSLYLSHIFTLGVFRVVWDKILPNGLGLNIWIDFCIFIFCSTLVCIIASLFVNKYVERPSSRLFKRFLFK